MSNAVLADSATLPETAGSGILVVSLQPGTNLKQVQEEKQCPSNFSSSSSTTITSTYVIDWLLTIYCNFNCRGKWEGQQSQTDQLDKLKKKVSAFVADYFIDAFNPRKMRYRHGLAPQKCRKSQKRRLKSIYSTIISILYYYLYYYLIYYSTNLWRGFWSKF